MLENGTLTLEEHPVLKRRRTIEALKQELAAADSLIEIKNIILKTILTIE